jgi:hypothetical protein
MTRPTDLDPSSSPRLAHATPTLPMTARAMLGRAPAMASMRAMVMPGPGRHAA